jgi:hypothetical protein
MAFVYLQQKKVLKFRSESLEFFHQVTYLWESLQTPIYIVGLAVGICFS